MPTDFSDDQVAAILAKEAKDASIKYSAMGLSAFTPAKYVRRILDLILELTHAAGHQ